MKKCTETNRRHNTRHAEKLENRRLRFQKKAKSARKRLQGVPHRRKRLESRQTEWIVCPAEFSLEQNRSGVIDVIRQIRKFSTVQGKYIYIDFRKIRTISLSGALVLVAELDRWNKLRRRPTHRLNTVDVADWDPKIRYLFGQLGFFNLLTANYPEALMNKDANENFSRFQYVKYRTGAKLDGATIEDLRTRDLEPVLGAIPNPKHFYGAVIEAMTNVDYHAYGESEHYNHWWLSAAIDKKEKEARIMLFDQGEGIPATLPKNFRESVVSVLKENHAGLIEAAHTVGRSASKKKNRGIGLERDVKRYLDVIDVDGIYRVQSLHGEYTLEKQSGVVAEPLLVNHENELPGTLIEWRILS